MKDLLVKYSEYFQGIHIVDILCLSFIFFGLYRGIKRGGYEMLPSFLKWLAGLCLGSLLYVWVASLVVSAFNFDISKSLTLSFLGINLIVWLVVILNEDFLKMKIKGSTVFRDIEVICGGILGTLNSFIILIFVFSLIHGNRTTDAVGQAEERRSKATFGSTLPNFYRMKKVVFGETYFGRLAKERLPLVLVSDSYEVVRAKNKRK